MKLSTTLSVCILLLAFACTKRSHKTFEKASVHQTVEGLVTPVALHFFENEYHLYYQYTKNDGNNGLGHLSSPDLLRWEEIAPIAEFQPDENFEAACVVRDWNNISGLGHESEVLLAYYLKDDLLSASYSNDFSKTWNVWNENINLDASFLGVNDLKVIWNDDAQQWIMVLLKEYRVEFYASVDLLTWEFRSLFEGAPAVKKGDWTSLEFFPIALQNTPEINWCLYISSTDGAANGGSGAQYFIGTFNNFQFHTEDDVKWMDSGTDYHSPVVLSDYLLLNKTPLCIGIIDKTQSLTLARSLSLTKRFNESFIISEPVKEFNQLQNKTRLIASTDFNGELKIKKTQQLPLEIRVTFDLNNRKYLDFAEVFGLILENENQEKLIVGYHNLRRYFFISYNNEIVYAPCIIDQPEVEIKLIVDDSTVELFAMDGFVSMAKYYGSKDLLNQLKLFTEGGKISLKEGSLTQLE